MVGCKTNSSSTYASCSNWVSACTPTTSYIKPADTHLHLHLQTHPSSLEAYRTCSVLALPPLDAGRAAPR